MAQDESGLPPLYMGSSDTIWRVNPADNTAETIFTLIGQPAVSVSTLSENEQSFLEGLNLSTSVDDHSVLYPSIAGMWSLSDGRLIVEVDQALCNRMVTGSRACAGYAQFLLIDRDNPAQLLTTLDYHYQPALEAWTCWRGNDAQVTNVIVNPIHDQAVIVLQKPHFQCDRANIWGILIDFSGADVQLRDFPLGYGFSWSPDGNHLAYLDLSACIDATDARFCSGELRVYETNGQQEATIPAQTGNHPHFSYDLVTWADENTLVYQQHVFDTDLGDPAEQYQLVWYDLVSNDTVISELEYFSRFVALYPLYGEAEILVGVRQDGEIVGFAPDAPYREVHHLTGFRLAYFVDNPANNSYLVLVDSSAANPLPGRDSYLLDSDFRYFAIPLAEVLGDTWIWYVTVVW
ncbi:MAG: hypothetical protein U0694_07405 [Anaerolineae bacterium]